MSNGMENQEQDLSVDLGQNVLGSPNQGSAMMYNMSQQNQQMPYGNRMPQYFPGNSMSLPGSGPFQTNQLNMAQPNFNGFPFPMQSGSVPNQAGSNMMQQNMEWFQNSMRGFNPQMLPAMNPGLGSNDFLALANTMMLNNMFRNQMGQPTPSMNQPMAQAMGMNPSMSQSFLQNAKIEDVLSSNMSNLNQFYNYIGAQNKDLTPNVNLSTMSNTGLNLMAAQRSTSDLLNESGMHLPSKTEFVQPMGNMKNFQLQGPQLNEEFLKQPPGGNTFDNRAQEAPKSHANSKNFGNNLNDERPLPASKGRNAAGGETKQQQQQQRSGFDWEDVPIKSKFGSKKQQQEEIEDMGEDDQYRAKPKNNYDYQEYKNPYDEVKISGKANKRFEDLLEEQLRKNPDAIGSKKVKEQNPNKQFLKKGARAFLSSAANRAHKTEGNQKENVPVSEGFQAGEGGVMAFSMGDKPASKSATSFPKAVKEKYDVNDASSNKGKGDKPKEPKKFLTRGAGRGGGIGAVPDKDGKTKNEDNQEKGERPKSTNARGKTDTKKQSGEDFNDRPIKTNDKPRGGFEQNRTEPSNGESNVQSLEKEYNFERYMKKSPRGVGKHKMKQSPKYTFDDENEEEEPAEEENQGYEDAPVSNLVNKYFYKKKPIQGKDNEGGEQEERNEEEEKIQKIVNEKIETLNSEIAKFKLENERVKKIRQKHEEMLKNLNKDIAEWNKQKDKEMRDFEEWKQEEIKKINNEKKLAERHQKTISNMPNRKEREEIDGLKKQIAKLMEELQTKDKRTKLNMDRLKRQIEEAEQRNHELTEELKCLQQLNPTAAISKVATSNNRNNQVKSLKNYDDEETYGENKYTIEDDEEGNYEKDDDASEDENDSESGQLKYEDIVNQPGKVGNKIESISSANRIGSQAPQLNEKGIKPNEKSTSLTTLNNKLGSQDSSVPVKAKIETGQKVPLGRDIDNEDDKVAGTSDYRFDSNAYYRKYVATKNEVNKIISQNTTVDGKVQRVYADGKKEVVFHNGVKREIYPDGYTIVHFTNNDIKQTLPDNTIIYFFADAKTTQTTLPNGRHIYKFANNQVEFHNPDGSKDIHFADQTRKIIFANGEEETIFTDGTVQRVNAQKIKTINYASGQKDVVYPDGLKIRTYPDGRVKKYHPDGTVEEM